MRLIFFVLLLVPLFLEANWKATSFPVRRNRITSLFGEFRGDHFHNGIDFSGTQRVYPIKEGEVIFTKDRAKNPLQLILGCGNLMVIEHEEVRSYYYHLKKGSVERDLVKVYPETFLAVSGNSGRSLGAHLHFLLEEFKKGRIVNPLKYLPKIEDVVKPRVPAILAVIANKIYKIKNRSFFNYGGTMKLFIVAWDLKPFYSPKTPINSYTGCGIKKITLKVDGKTLRSYDFSYLTKENKNLLVSSKYSFKETYGVKHNYRLGAFTPRKKRHVFEGECEDWAGNKNSFSVEVFFRFKEKLALKRKKRKKR